MTQIVKDLAKQLGEERVQYHAPHVWLYRCQHSSIIIKLEKTMQDNHLFVNASFARDGSGPLLASFMSMLLIEECHATTSDTFGICSGLASVTLHHILDITSLDHHRLQAYLENFETLALCVLAQAGKRTSHASIAQAPSVSKML